MSELLGGGVDQEPPKIEFPCDYLIKIMGEALPDFADKVLDIIERFAVIPDRNSVLVRPSSKGTFVSVNIVIVATGADQLQDIHMALREYKAVKMVI